MHFLFHWHQFMLTTLMINGECVYNWVGGIENHLHSLRLNLCKFSFCLKGETVLHAISTILNDSVQAFNSWKKPCWLVVTDRDDNILQLISCPDFPLHILRSFEMIAFRRTALYCQCNYVTIVLWIKAQVQPTQLKFNLTFNIKRKISTFIDNDNRSKWWNIVAVDDNKIISDDRLWSDEYDICIDM